MTALWQIECEGLSDVGLRRRINEDDWMARPETGLFAVADGMGGHSCGDVASGMIVQALKALEPAPDARTMRARVEAALVQVNRALQAGRGREISGSTVVVLLICGRHYAVLWAGDSRVYRLRQGSFELLTRDHSAVQEMVDRGALTPEAARGHPLSNRITRAVGAAAELALEGAQGELQAEDAFLLCSDGLTRHVEDEEIGAALAGHAPKEAAERLMALTLARGAEDNVTLVSLRVHALAGAAP